MVEEVELVGCCAGRAVLDPVIGNALRVVGNGDCAALLESEGFERAPHRGVVLVGVATQVVSVLSRKVENCPRDPMPAHCCHAVNHVVLSLEMPCAVDLGIRLIRSWSEGENSKWPLIVSHKETVPVRDVFLSVNVARVSEGPLSRIPIRLHKRAGMHIRAPDECDVARGCDSNLHPEIVHANYSSFAKGEKYCMWDLRCVYFDLMQSKCMR